MNASDTKNAVAKALSVITNFGDEARARQWLNAVAVAANSAGAQQATALSIPANWSFTKSAGAPGRNNLDTLTDVIGQSALHNIVKAATWSLFIGDIDITYDNTVTGNPLKTLYVSTAAQDCVTHEEPLQSSWDKFRLNGVTLNHMEIKAADEAIYNFNGVILTYTTS